MPTTYAIPNGRTVMDASLYTGNNTTNVISNADNGTVGFKPDLVWIKSRSNVTQNTLQDSVRGANRYVISNSIAIEGTDGSVTAFNSNGFNLTTDAGVSYNYNGYTYVGWQWQAGQGTTSNNTSGSLTSTVSVNQTAGFSIVTYTGNGSNPQTVGHGLGAAPSLMFIKVRSGSGATGSWITYHKDVGPTQYLLLDYPDAAATSISAFNNTSPTSTVFSINSYCNYSNGWGYVAYCWTPIPGFSAFGSYTGNGSTDGPFVYTGFRPKFVLWKCTSNGTTDWNIADTSRDTYNAAAKYLRPDTTGAEGNDGPLMDILSNGFKLRTFFSDTNGNGRTYVYAAFAENPFKYANAR